MRVLEDIIYPVVDVLHSTAPGLAKSPQTVLFGLDAALDSISLVTFITAVEERTQAVTGRKLALITPETMTMKQNPFLTLGTLADYLHQRLGLTNDTTRG